MGDALEKSIAADEAIEAAFEVFKKYVQRGRSFDHALLEGLDRSGEDWVVRIGLDDGRFREEVSTLSFGQRTREPIREVRSIDISGRTGEMIRIY